MTDLVVITPSFGPDAGLFGELHQSVLDHTPEDTVHHVVVPDQDAALFAPYAGRRCRVWLDSDLLPRRYRRVPGTRIHVNTHRPWTPVRGWIRQQAHKIALTALLDAERALIADSDVVLVRPPTAEAVGTSARPRLYRNDDAVHAGMARHVEWHRVARELLGIDPRFGLPQHDYVSPLNVWDPATARALQRRIETVTGRHWLDAFTAELHVSEFILYGVFADSPLNPAGRPDALDPDFCHNYWGVQPFDDDEARAFGERLPAAALGMMISAKSGTAPRARLEARRRCASVTGLG